MLEPGSGYCSPPTVKVEGFPDSDLTATLKFSKDLKKNGGIEAVEAGTVKAAKK